MAHLSRALGAVLRRLRLLTSTVALTVIAVGSTAAPAPAAVVDCKNFELGAFVYAFSARNMQCSTAKRYIRQAYGDTGFNFRALRRRGYSCRQIETVYEGTTYRCTKSSRTFRWTFGS